MKEKILAKAKVDIPLYFNDFKSFWDESLANISDDDLADIYNATLIYKNWKLSFHNIKLRDFDLIIDEIFEDINSSFFLSLMGLYRSAHMHLRSSIELTLQLIFFIDHPIEYIKWKDGDYVIKQDVLSQYIKSHPLIEIEIDTLMTNITTNWKKFSKHIHGESPMFFQCEKGVRKTNTFTIADFNIWKQNFTQNVYNLNKLLLIFFKKNLNLFPSKSRDILLNHLKAEDLNIFQNI